MRPLKVLNQHYNYKYNIYFQASFYSYSCYFPEIRIVIVATRMAGKADLTSHAKSVHLCK